VSEMELGDGVELRIRILVRLDEIEDAFTLVSDLMYIDKSHTWYPHSVFELSSTEGQHHYQLNSFTP
jgi:hypothetical protein